MANSGANLFGWSFASSRHMLIDDGTQGITYQINGAAIAVHKRYGAGLLEHAYRPPMVGELEKRGLIVECERPLPLAYDDTTVPCAYKIDLVVNDLVIVELKSVERLLPVHIAQVRTYLKLAGLKVGLLINFNVSRMADGIHRILHPDLSTPLARIKKEADDRSGRP